MQVTLESEQLVEIPEAGSEQTLAEYLQQLNSDLSEVNRFVYSAQVDGEEINDELNQKQCSEFEELHVEVRSFEAMAVDSIGQLGEYCQKFLASLPKVINNWSEKDKEEKDQHRQQMLEACELSAEVLEAMDSLLNISTETDEELLARVHKLEGELREAGRDELKKLLSENCRDLFTDLLEQMETTLSGLEDREEKFIDQVDTIQGKVTDLLEELPDLIEVLQAGEEAEGYTDLQEQTENIRKIITIISVFDQAGQIKQNFTPEEQEKLISIHTELTHGFDDLQDAIESKDLIMICDILEYEVIPYLETIRELFGSKQSEE